MAERIRSEADKERTVLLADAYRQSEEIRGLGDAESAAIYARAYERDPEFYSFHRSMEAYRRSLGSGDDIFVLAPEGDYFRYLNNPKGGTSP
jgi:membrane protease subunit HflC